MLTFKDIPYPDLEYFIRLINIFVLNRGNSVYFSHEKAVG